MGSPWRKITFPEVKLCIPYIVLIQNFRLIYICCNWYEAKVAQWCATVIQQSQIRIRPSQVRGIFCQFLSGLPPGMDR
jgi:hypothetical protein